jgi:hypothetical protein
MKRGLCHETKKATQFFAWLGVRIAEGKGFEPSTACAAPDFESRRIPQKTREITHFFNKRSTRRSALVDQPWRSFTALPKSVLYILTRTRILCFGAAKKRSIYSINSRIHCHLRNYYRPVYWSCRTLPHIRTHLHRFASGRHNWADRSVRGANKPCQSCAALPKSALYILYTREHGSHTLLQAKR